MKDYVEIREEIENETGRGATVFEIQERQIDRMCAEIDASREIIRNLYEKMAMQLQQIRDAEKERSVAS